METELKALLDERAINRLAVDYAEAVDRLNEALLRAVFADDAVMEGPGWRFSGIEEICTILPMMKDMFVSSWHALHQHSVRLAGDTATGENYCAGRHLQKGGYAENQVVTMVIRYRDRYVRTEAGWRIAHRKEIIDWTEVSTIQGGRRD